MALRFDGLLHSITDIGAPDVRIGGERRTMQPEFPAGVRSTILVAVPLTPDEIARLADGPASPQGRPRAVVSGGGAIPDPVTGNSAPSPARAERFTACAK